MVDKKGERERTRDREEEMEKRTYKTNKFFFLFFCLFVYQRSFIVSRFSNKRQSITQN